MSRTPCDPVRPSAALAAATLVLVIAATLLAEPVDHSARTASKLHDPTAVRIALVTNCSNDVVRDTIALAEAQIAPNEDVALLERAAVDRLLDEHELALSGLADMATAIRVGKVLAVDLLGVLEGNPKATNQAAFGLVIFDARTGVRLCDEAMPVDPEKGAGKIVDTLETAVAKYRSPAASKKTVSIVTVRNVDLPMDKDAVCEAVGRILERRLVRSPDVLVLERRLLEHVGRERAISAEAPANALLASVTMIELEIARAGKNGLQATAILTSLGRTKRRIEVASERGETLELVDRLLGAVLREIHAAAAKRETDRSADARRMAAEAEYAWSTQRFHRAIVLVESAMALTPSDHRLRLTGGKLYYFSSLDAFDPDAAKGAGLVLIPRRLTEKTRKKALVCAIRSVELFTAYYRQKASLDQLTIRAMRRAPEGYVFDVADYIAVLASSPGGHSDETAGLMATLRSRYRQLTLDRLLPFFGEKWRRGPFKATYLDPYMVVLANCRQWLPDASQWTDVMVAHGQRVLEYVDRRGSVATDCEGVTVTYVYPLAAMTPPAWNSHWLFPPTGHQRLRVLYDEMEQHRLPGVQAFGMLGNLWIRQKGTSMTVDEVEQRAQAIFDFAKKAIENPAVRGADCERLACYEVMCAVISSTRLSNRARGQLMDDLLEFTVSRKETTLGLVRMGAFPTKTRLHAHYVLNSFVHANIWPDILWIKPESRDVARVHRLTDELTVGLASDEIRCLDGRKHEIARALGRASEELARLGPQTPKGNRLSHTPWIRAYNLTPSHDEPGYLLLSHSMVRRGAVYIAGTTLPRPGHVYLFRASLDSPTKIERISEIHGQPGGPDGTSNDAITVRRQQPTVADGQLFFACPDRGGIVVFSTDGSAPRWITPANTPGMPVATIDHVVPTGTAVFALTDSRGLESKRAAMVIRGRDGSRKPVSDPAGGDARSYVHWYEPDKGGWQVIASSGRAERKTPLDTPQRFIPGATYDPATKRVLLVAGQGADQGIYAFDTVTHGLARIRAFPNFRPAWYGRLPGDRLWFAFRPPTGRFGIANLIEYDIRADRWRELVHWRDSPKAAFHVEGLPRSKHVIPNARDVYPPFAQIDGWIWCFHPLARFSPDGRTYQQFEDPLCTPENPTGNKGGVETGRFKANTLQFLPRHRAILYGTSRALWYLKLPAQPDRPPDQ